MEKLFKLEMLVLLLVKEIFPDSKEQVILWVILQEHLNPTHIVQALQKQKVEVLA